MNTTRIIGIDPSLVACGWGIMDKTGNKISHVAHGVIRPPRKMLNGANVKAGDAADALAIAITHGNHLVKLSGLSRRAG